MRLAVCWKWAPRRFEVDPLSAAVHVDARSAGASAADQAALELALRLGSAGTEIIVVTAGPAEAEVVLREALATGATRAIRCPGPPDAGSAAVAQAVAGAVRGVDLVLCGDYSADRGSGSVPAFLAAELEAAQALGVVSLDRTADGTFVAERRLDRGRRERLRLPHPAVVSVEGSVARLRRAPLAAVLAAAARPIELGPVVGPDALAGGVVRAGRVRPFRPRPHPRPGPAADASPLSRIIELTAALTERTPPRLVTLDPQAAADCILEQLSAWGYSISPVEEQNVEVGGERSEEGGSAPA